jgi:hypothetical protein
MKILISTTTLALTAVSGVVVASPLALAGDIQDAGR